MNSKPPNQLEGARQRKKQANTGEKQCEEQA